MRVAACQLPEVRNDARRALSVVASYAADAARAGAALVCFPECFLQGYTAEPGEVAALAIDLDSREFERILGSLADLTPTVILGLIERDRDAFFNTAAVIQRGALVARYRKTHLLKAEQDVFTPGNSYPVVDVGGVKVGINICYDVCFADAVVGAALAGAELVACPCSNMLPRDMAEQWRLRHNEIRSERAKEAGVWLLSSDVTGERDGRISYGPTAVIDPQGRVVQQVPPLTTGMVVAEVD